MLQFKQFGQKPSTENTRNYLLKKLQVTCPVKGKWTYTIRSKWNFSPNAFLQRYFELAETTKSQANTFLEQRQPKRYGTKGIPFRIQELEKLLLDALRETFVRCTAKTSKIVYLKDTSNGYQKTQITDILSILKKFF